MTLEQQLRNHYASEPITLDELRRRLQANDAIIDFDPQAITPDDLEFDPLGGDDSDELDRLLLASPKRATTPEARSRWRYAAAAALLMIGLVAATQLGSANDTNAIHSGDATPTPEWVQIDQRDTFTPAAVPSKSDDPVTWREQNQIGVTEIESTSLGYFALGTERRAGHGTGAVWRSENGRSWTRVPDLDNLWGSLENPPAGQTRPMEAGMWTIAESNGIVVIGGYFSQDLGSGGPAVTWASIDGIHWTESVLPDDNAFAMRSVVGTADGFLAFSWGFTEPTADVNTVWRSTDGVAWERVETEGLAQASSISSMMTIETENGQRVVAVGATGTLDQRPTAWYSDDGGTTWIAATAEELPLDRPYGELTDVQVGPAGLVAVAARRSGAAATEPSSSLVVWQSADGETWQEELIDAGEGVEWWWPGLAGSPDGFLVTAYAGTDDEAIGASWITTDGRNLIRLDHPDGRAGGVPEATDDGYITITPVLAGSESSNVPPVANPAEVWALSANTD